MMENAEKTINQQQQMLQRRENVKETLQKHKVITVLLLINAPGLIKAPASFAEIMLYD